MRKLIESTFVSIDGFVSPTERLSALLTAENLAHALSELTGCDALVLGRTSYELFAERFPKRAGVPFYDLANRIPKYVASKTLREATWNATVLRGDAAAEIARLKQQPGTDLLKYGWSSLDRTLLDHRLVDEVRLSIFPIALGAGTKLFDGIDAARLGLRLTDSKVFGNGIVHATYVPSYG